MIIPKQIKHSFTDQHFLSDYRKAPEFGPVRNTKMNETEALLSRV